jgi:hypothetical protein
MYIEVGKTPRVCNTLNLFLQNGGAAESYDKWCTNEHLFPDPDASAEYSETLNLANFMARGDIKVSIVRTRKYLIFVKPITKIRTNPECWNPNFDIEFSQYSSLSGY